nr:DUF1287 domain-containing protein [Brevundimonas lenta]
MSPSSPEPSSEGAPTRRLLLAGGLTALVPLGGCSGAIAVDVSAGGPSKLAAAAQKQLGVTKEYDAAYARLPYPGGDVPRKTGACSDVIIRAARDGLGLDLQKLVHEDMEANFAAYPSKRLWNLDRPDPNIDHRRVPNLEAYFRRQGARVWEATEKTGGAAFPEPLETGDILSWRSGGGASHIGLVTRGGKDPLILHNVGHGAMQHALWPMGFWRGAVGHYRWPVSA